jgi:hypothetical protein
MGRYQPRRYIPIASQCRAQRLSPQLNEVTPVLLHPPCRWFATGYFAPPQKRGRWAIDVLPALDLRGEFGTNSIVRSTRDRTARYLF